MEYLFEKCHGKRTVLISPSEILENIAPKFEITAKQLEFAVKNIVLDGYVDVYHSDKKGSLVYVVTLKQKGEAYQRELDEIKQKRVRSIGWKLLLTAIGVIATYVLTRVFF
jgi:predicted transcriptional regulator